MSNLFDQIKVLFENQLYSNVVALASFALSIDHNLEATSPEKFQTYVYYGNSLFHLGQYRRAEAMYNRALQFRKGYFKFVGSNKTTASLKEFMPDIDIKYQIHLCHINLKQNQEAVTVLETIPGKQRSPKVNMALGKLYQLGGMERSSVYAFKEVLKECPLALEAIEGLLSLRLSGAEVQSFVMECAAQKGIGNTDWVMSWIKAHDQINSREYGHAINTLKQMEKQSCIKNNHNLLIMLGETYHNAGDSKNALSVLQRAHLIEPQLEKGLDILASLLAKEKKLAELEKLVPTYVPLREYGPETWIAMAYYLYVNKKTSKAAYLAQKACLLNPRNVEGLLLKAAIFLDLKKYQDSVVHYRETMHLAPYRYEAYEGLVNCYVAMHRLREALTVASGVCKQLGQSPRTLTLYASVLMKDSVSVCKAKGLLEKALQQDDKYLPAVYLLVIILDQELNLERAISILEKQIQIQPNCKLHHMLGDLYAKNHQQEKATEQYMIALQMDPSNRRLQEAMSKLNQNCSKIDTSYYDAVNDDDNINTAYELGDSENEMNSSFSEQENFPPESVLDSNTIESKESENNNEAVMFITKNIPLKVQLVQEIQEETKAISVTVPAAPPLPKAKESSYSSLCSDDFKETVTVPATEIKKITTIQKTCPKKVETLVLTKQEPIITIKRQGKKEVTEIKTPIARRLTTTTTVKRTTFVTTETTTVIGNAEGKKRGEKLRSKNRRIE